MLGIVGTIPDPQFPLIHGRVHWDNGCIRIKKRRIPVNRCTPALIAAALKTAECIRCPAIYAFLIGDTGTGDGSRQLYRFLSRHLTDFDFQVLTFHYLQPDVDWHNRVLFAVDAMPRRPILIADAGFMYAAKMSGQAEQYDFFTPDAGELAFLADELAPHPFYTRGFILHQDNPVADLIQDAYRFKNAARHLLVKGETDHIVCEGRTVETVSRPAFDAMEAIGGTGDSLTGLLSALCGAGLAPVDAAVLAARTNRCTGHYTRLSPATRVDELIEHIPQALAKLLKTAELQRGRSDESLTAETRDMVRIQNNRG